jgi:hypothetical protein
MKTIKLLALFIIISFSFNAFAEENNISIIDVDSTNSNIVKIFFDKDIETNIQNVVSDIKIFKDLNNDNISIDLVNDRLIHLKLKDDIIWNTSYSLLSLYWTEWTIDFKLEDIIFPIEMIWDSSEWIQKLIIIDSNSIDIYFKEAIEKEAIETDSVDIKLLREYNIESLQINSDNSKELNVSLINELYDNSKYIAMIFSLTTMEEVNYNISNPIYDFMTKVELLEEIEVPLNNGEIWEEIEVPLNNGEIWEEIEVPLNNGEIWKEIEVPLNNGEFWEEIEVPLNNGEIWKEIEVPLNNGEIWKEIEVPLNNGEIWKEIEVPLNNGEIWKEIEVPLNNGEIWEEIEVPLNNGEIWKEIEAPLNNGEIWKEIEAPLNNWETWKKIDDIALNLTKTPNTWAETWILILATFISSIFIFCRKRFIKM